MNKFHFHFHGRQTGAIGIFYDIHEDYEASCFEEACSMLYIDYEHIRFYSAAGQGKRYDVNEFDKAVQTGYLTDYKGKGSARK